MKPRDRQLAVNLEAQLRRHAEDELRLPGIQDAEACGVLIEQLIESIRRIRYIQVVRAQGVSPLRADPSSDRFHPVKGAIHKQSMGDVEEAFWLVFLAVYFGRNHKTGWQLLRDVYGGLGQGTVWDWPATSADPIRFRRWLAANQATLRGADGIRRSFGNHRKYESINAWSDRGTGAAVQSYIEWIAPAGSQTAKFSEAIRATNGDCFQAFDRLYRTIHVESFGRTAKFDFLTMIGKLGLAAIEPPSTYMNGATGPLAGARLLFGGNKTAALNPGDLENHLRSLGVSLGVGMQVLEDALCNWQKSPRQFVPFRG